MVLLFNLAKFFQKSEIWELLLLSKITFKNDLHFFYHQFCPVSVLKKKLPLCPCVRHFFYNFFSTNKIK